MLTWRYGTVTKVCRTWRGTCEVDVALQARSPRDPQHAKAIAYPDLVGQPQLHDRVLLNCNALLANLGTGGYATVVALPDRLPADIEPAGHIVKARYTPQQTILTSVSEPVSPHREVMENVDTITGMPVVTADLHSALPAVIAGVRASVANARLVYVMTDGGALPAWFSHTLDELHSHMQGVVTCGQSFGGDLEAENIHTGLLAARHVLNADIAVVTQGPGNTGTGIKWGFSGTACGDAVNAIAVLEGRPVGALRMSSADPRQRHRGISHHSLTAYATVALARATLPVPRPLEVELSATVNTQLAQLSSKHDVTTVDTKGLREALLKSPAHLSTMGRKLDDDPVYFLAAAVAGRYAASLL